MHSKIWHLCCVKRTNGCYNLLSFFRYDVKCSQLKLDYPQHGLMQNTQKFFIDIFYVSYLEYFGVLTGVFKQKTRTGSESTQITIYVTPLIYGLHAKYVQLFLVSRKQPQDT